VHPPEEVVGLLLGECGVGLVEQEHPGVLHQGAGDLGALAFADRAQSLGANLGASAGLDSSTAYLSALKQNLEPSVTT
jgi:hypothetical protein